MYVYKQTERTLWTVGFYMPDGRWEPESDHDSPEEAAKRVHYLNGSRDGELVRLVHQCDDLLTLCQQSYGVLVASRWDGRCTMEGQGLLCQLRNRIAELTGKTIQEVQEAAEEKAAKAIIARAHSANQGE